MSVASATGEHLFCQRNSRFAVFAHVVFDINHDVEGAGVIANKSTGNFQTRHYTATADGQRFIANVSAASAPFPTVVLNSAPPLKHAE